jgi:bacterial/archaeal transporter family protein
MPPWLLYALLSALAAAFVGIFGKIGMKNIDSNLATILRSIIMTAFLLGTGATLRLWPKLQTVTGKALLAITLSGIAGALSWLFYFKALQLGNVSKVAPIDKLSMPFAVLLATLILSERPSALNWLGIALIATGAYLATLPAPVVK